MNFLQKAALRLSGYSAKATIPGRAIALIAGYLAGVLWNIDATWQALVAETYGKNPVAYICVRLLSQSVPEARLTAYTGEGDKRKELPSDHPLRVLLRRPNELMTRFETDELTTIHMCVVGRSVWWKERSKAGQVIALWPLRPDRVGPVYSTSQEPGQRVIAGYAYQPPDSQAPVLIPRKDCLAFNFPDPDGESGGMVEGFGPLSAVRSQIAADNRATDHVGALLANYAQPGIVIEMGADAPSVTEEEANLIKAKFRQEFGGQRLGVPGLIQGGAKVTPLGFTLRDLEFPDLRSNAEARICGAMGVPAILAGVKAGLDAATYSNVQGARQFFAETTLSWYWRRYADQYSQDLGSEFGDDITCEYDTSEVRALAGQKIEKLTPIKDAWAAGVAMRNEYRIALNLEPLDPELGEVLWQANSGTVVPATEKARAAAEKRAAAEQKKQEEAAAKLREEQAKEQARLEPPEEREALPEGEQEEVRQLPPGRQEQPVQAPGTNGHGQRPPAGGQMVPPAKKAGPEIVVIPLDDELASALEASVSANGSARRA